MRRCLLKFRGIWFSIPCLSLVFWNVKRKKVYSISSMWNLQMKFQGALNKACKRFKSSQGLQSGGSTFPYS
ncbi:hypothetical protein CIPAW_11G121400 [Carya illinoinensis]|uniref:Uncharacterized protein n=1 Tax=Carya illinoinensis TaxID=32201 RepID=A0A8T1P474_CARIL|nr:hypothetical protein CIPAW_11G121400 [Carya illinoinensis]